MLEEGPDERLVPGRQLIFVLAVARRRRRRRASSGARFNAEEPIVDLRAFTNRNFAFGSPFTFVMGIGLYGLTYLYPVFLGRVRGYSSLMIGETMFVTGPAMFFTAPIAGHAVAQARSARHDGDRLRRLRRRHLA